MEKVLGKIFRISGLDERKGDWVLQEDFHGNFQVNVTWFFAFTCLTDLCFVTLHKLDDKVVLDR